MRGDGVSGGRRAGGFALLEAVLVMALVASLAYWGSTAIVVVYESKERTVRRGDAMQVLRLALERMRQDIASIRSASPGDVSGMQGSTFEFVRSNGETVTYALDPGTGILSRSGIPLAHGVASLQFAYLDAAGGSTGDPTLLRRVRVDLTFDSVSPPVAAAAEIELRNAWWVVNLWSPE